MKQKGHRGKADGKERIAAWYEDEITISDSSHAKLLHFVSKTLVSDRPVINTVIINK